MELQSLSEVTIGRTTVFQSNQTVPTTTFVLKLTAHQDGGNSGDMKELTLSTRKERLSMFQVEEMMRTETSSHGRSIADLTNNGTLSMPMNIQLNQPRENSTKTSVSMFKEISSLFLNFQTTDILILSTTETL
jgi:hypothetical protein